MSETARQRARVVMNTFADMSGDLERFEAYLETEFYGAIADITKTALTACRAAYKRGVAETELRDKAAQQIIEAARTFKDLMTNWGGEFKIQVKDLAATMTAGSMIEKFRNGLDAYDAALKKGTMSEPNITWVCGEGRHYECEGTCYVAEMVPERCECTCHRHGLAECGHPRPNLDTHCGACVEELRKKLKDSEATKDSAILAVTDYKDRWVETAKRVEVVGKVGAERDVANRRIIATLQEQREELRQTISGMTDVLKKADEEFEAIGGHGDTETYAACAAMREVIREALKKGETGNYIEGPGTSTDKPHPMVPIWKLEKRLAEAETVVTAVRELMHDRTTRKTFSFVLMGNVGDALVAYDKSAQKDRPALKKRPDQCLAENPGGLMCHLTEGHDGPHEGMAQGKGYFSDYVKD